MRLCDEGSGGKANDQESMGYMLLEAVVSSKGFIPMKLKR